MICLNGMGEELFNLGEDMSANLNGVSINAYMSLSGGFHLDN